VDVVGHVVDVALLSVIWDEILTTSRAGDNGMSDSAGITMLFLDPHVFARVDDLVFLVVYVTQREKSEIS